MKKLIKLCIIALGITSANAENYKCVINLDLYNTHVVTTNKARMKYDLHKAEYYAWVSLDNLIQANKYCVDADRMVELEQLTDRMLKQITLIKNMQQSLIKH